MCDRILNGNICREESAAARKWRKQSKTVKSEEKRKKSASLFLYILVSCFGLLQSNRRGFRKKCKNKLVKPHSQKLYKLWSFMHLLFLVNSQN